MRPTLALLLLSLSAPLACQPPPPACISDVECEGGLLCRAESCVPPESQCNSHSDCETHERCSSGTCVFAKTCYSHDDCENSEQCTDNICRNATCGLELCPPGFVCGSDDECIPIPCTSNAECGPNAICNKETGSCADPSEVPRPEVCDGTDNDLDGEIDEGYEVGATCELGLGECHREGAVVCLEDGTSACDVVLPSPDRELCNGLDDDCDGFVDEDYAVGEGCVAGEGECAAGVHACTRTGGIECVPLTDPIEELCDQLDNDCDGLVDEGFIDGDGACEYGLGTCAVPGWQQCSADGTSSTCVPSIEPQPSPSSELCDGLDNDCDGLVDEEAGC